MSESVGYSIGEAVVVKALYEVLVVEADRKREIKVELARLEKENPQTVEAFDEREAQIKALLDEFSELGGK